MDQLTPDPLHVLQVATEYQIPEDQAATAIIWAARMTAHAWDVCADVLGLVKDDYVAMVAWFHSLGSDARRELMDDAVAAVVGADKVLDEIYRERDGKRAVHGCARSRVLRTNRPRVHIR